MLLKTKERPSAAQRKTGMFMKTKVVMLLKRECI
jgi:hypothetical protein